MQLSGVVERLEQVVETTGAPDAVPADLRAALQATVEVQSFIAAQRAELIRALGEHPTSLPEAAIAATSRCSLGAATRETDRANTLDAAAAVADALSDGDITSGHVDALTRATRNLDAAASSALLADDEALAHAAATRSIAEFDAYVKRKAKQLDRRNDEERLAQQQRAARLRTWTDDDGMWNLKGRFDPMLGKGLARAVAAATHRKFTDVTPSTAPDDPFERKQHLEALALVDLVLDDGERATGSASSGPPMVVVDASLSDGAGGPIVDWGIPVELPVSVLTDVFDVRDPTVVIIRNGVVLHAPGRLDLGRSSRLANRDQRRALQSLYSTCAIPGCTVHYDRCKLHHIVWWRLGGRTDLENLLPVCQHHHTRIHDHAWQIELGANRELTITLPDGQIMRTGPPRRSAA
ncbi:MAG: HNH endonuclease [Ilumatobacter sp.]